MRSSLPVATVNNKLLLGAIIAANFVGAILLGTRASFLWFALLIVGWGALQLLLRPVLGLLGIIILALFVPVRIGTGTAVASNLTTFFVGAMAGIWLLRSLVLSNVRFVTSRLNRPLFLFVLASLISLAIGNAIWDPSIFRPDYFIVVQLAQWAIFALSAAALVLVANLVTDEHTLRRFTFSFLALAGALAILGAILGTRLLVNQIATVALIRTPFWILLVAVAGSQLMFNHKLSPPWKIFAILCIGASIIYAVVQEQEAVANWVGIAIVVAVLGWLKWPRLRWPVVVILILLALSGVLFSGVYEFAGGEREWRVSGAARLSLTERVIDVTMRNPITGLGPASYRMYANAEPLQYGRAYWVQPQVSSHNNYVDIFAHTGIIGLGLFLWFMVEVGLLAWRLGKRKNLSSFGRSYVNAMFAAWVSISLIMLILDWFLPFVYNVSFDGFQASVLVWLFFGGLVFYERHQGWADQT